MQNMHPRPSFLSLTAAKIESIVCTPISSTWDLSSYCTDGDKRSWAEKEKKTYTWINKIESSSVNLNLRARILNLLINYQQRRIDLFMSFKGKKVSRHYTSSWEVKCSLKEKWSDIPWTINYQTYLNIYLLPLERIQPIFRMTKSEMRVLLIKE